jgi:hypothetical protein
MVTAVQDGGWTVDSVLGHFSNVFGSQLQEFRPKRREAS